MSMKSHIESLERKHNELESRIRDAYIHHISEFELTKLKKEKLKIKDQINSLLNADLQAA